jgi:hypothetical protein
MIGGRIAGQVISEHLKSGVPLSEFEIRWKKQMGKVMSNSKKAFIFGSYILRLPDWIINLIFNRFTKPFVWRSITCRNMFFIF